MTSEEGFLDKIFSSNTKADPYLKTDEELLRIVIERLEMRPKDTGVCDLGVMEGAIGALFVGQRYGLRILRILHTTKTIRKYEQFLGVPLDQLLPQHGPLIDRSVAWGIAMAAKNATAKYWDLVARKTSMPGHEKRTVVDTVPEAQ